MEIQVQKIVDMVPAEQIRTITLTKTPAEIKKDGLAAALGELLDNFEASVAANEMTQANLDIATEVPVAFRLETNVINLPLADSNKLYQFFDLDATAAVNVYLIVESEDINVSHLRIDKIAPVDDFLSDQDQVRAQIIQAAQEKWDFLQTVEHPTPEEKAAAEKAEAAKQAAAKPAPKRRTTTRKSPAKKTTARKKAPAKKAATRSTTAAKKAPAKKKTTRSTTAAKKTPAKKTTTAKKTPAARTRAKKTTED